MTIGMGHDVSAGRGHPSMADAKARPAGLKTLIVFHEDPAEGRAIETVLTRGGHKALWASIPAQALYMLNPSFLGLVVMTIQGEFLPLFSRVRQRWPNVPIVAICAPIQDTEAFALGAVDCLRTPTDRVELLAVVQKHLNSVR